MKKIPLLTIVFAALAFTTSMAQDAHPNYTQALSDLRVARWLIQHPAANTQITKNESTATAAIDDAIDKIKKAGIDDGKTNNDHPKISDFPNNRERLEKAMTWLDKAHADMDKEQDLNFGDGLKTKVAKDALDARDSVKMSLATGK